MVLFASPSDAVQNVFWENQNTRFHYICHLKKAQIDLKHPEIPAKFKLLSGSNKTFNTGESIE